MVTTLYTYNVEKDVGLMVSIKNKILMKIEWWLEESIPGFLAAKMLIRKPWKTKPDHKNTVFIKINNRKHGFPCGKNFNNVETELQI